MNLKSVSINTPKQKKHRYFLGVQERECTAVLAEEQRDLTISTLEIHTACCKYRNFELRALAVPFCFKNTDRICSLFRTESRSSVYFPPFIALRTQVHCMCNTVDSNHMAQILYNFL